MTHFSVMNTYLCLQVFPKVVVKYGFPSSVTVFITYRKLNCAYLRHDSVGMSRKLNIAKRVMLSQTKRPALRPISRSKQATEMKQKATNS